MAGRLDRLRSGCGPESSQHVVSYEAHSASYIGTTAASRTTVNELDGLGELEGARRNASYVTAPRPSR